MSTRRAAGIEYVRRGSGSPLVLIHGLGGDHGVWEPVLDPLAREHDVIVPDLPGFGASAPLPAGVAPTAAALAEPVAGLLDELGVERAHLAGNSLGAWVAFELALLERASSVIAIAPAGLWGKPLKQRDDRIARWVARRLLPAAPLLFRNGPLRSLIFRWSVAHPRRLDPRAATRLAQRYLEAPGFRAADSAMRAGRFTAEDRLAVPVTIAWCEHDRQVGPPRRELPWARIVTLEDVGHVPMWDDAELVVRTILEATSQTAAGAAESASG